MTTPQHSYTDRVLSDAIHQRGIILERRDGVVYTNVPHLVTHHSPDGFEFGFAGSGPADLALNILEWLLKDVGYEGDRQKIWRGYCFQLAYHLHQHLKVDIIARMPRAGGVIKVNAVKDWLAAYLPKEKDADYWREIDGLLDDWSAHREQ
jgi:hypothetical protein